MRRHGVTLIELLFVMVILAILGAVSLSGYAAAVAQARIERTRAVVTKLNKLVLERWDSYRTRAVPIKIPAGTDPRTAALYRLYSLRELQRVELPDRISDLCNDAELADLQADGDLDVMTNGGAKLIYLTATPSITNNYRRRARAGMMGSWTTKHEGAECLYLIIAGMRDGEGSALDFFAASEIGDVDGDGMKEFHDAWGNPIEFLRWAPGYSENPGPDGGFGVKGVDDDGDGRIDHPKEFLWPGSDDVYGPMTPQTRDYDKDKAPDPFDPLMVDPRWADNDYSFAPFALKPLIFSPGPDKEYDITTGPATGLVYATLTLANDPYLGATPLVGTPTGTGAADNITNHDFTEK